MTCKENQQAPIRSKIGSEIQAASSVGVGSVTLLPLLPFALVLEPPLRPGRVGVGGSVAGHESPPEALPVPSHPLSSLVVGVALLVLSRFGLSDVTLEALVEVLPLSPECPVELDPGDHLGRAPGLGLTAVVSKVELLA